ncbi:MAG: efflux transporter periplasmic adaptor subunit [Caulobacteraceae bacterium]|nr:efflux transporter periplasmic adaptor subunit [Caulobacteraceae bacterium]
MKTKTVVVWVVVGVVLAASGALALSGKLTPKKTSTYITQPVQVADIESSVMATGILEPAEVVDVNPQVAGQLIEMTAKLGDHVTKTQKLGAIDAATLTNAVRTATNQKQQAQVSLNNANIQLVTAENTQIRQHALLAQGVASQSTVDSSDNAVRQATIQVQNATLSLQNNDLAIEQANVNLEKANVRSPIDGIVAEVVLQEGATLNLNNQLPVIVRIAKMDVMTVRTQISEADIIKVNEGQTVYFTILGDPTKKYYGKLRAVEFTPSTGTLDPSKGGPSKDAIYYNAVFDVANTDGRLLPGMTANVHVVLGEAKAVPTIPVAALGKAIGADRYVVQVQDSKGQVQPREITTGLSDELKIEVKQGLNKGDKVVIGDSSQTPGSAPAAGGAAGLMSSLKS